MQQRSDEWFAERAGKLTASRMADAMSYVKSGAPSAARTNLLHTIALERITGTPQGPDLSRVACVQWGVEQEENAKRAISIEHGFFGDDVGFVQHPTIEGLGASPDWVFNGQPIEIKCPESKTHLEYLMAGGLPDKYKPQLALQCLCMGVTEGLFFSFDPRFPEHLQLFMCEFKPGSEYLEHVESEAVKFLKEVDEICNRILDLR